MSSTAFENVDFTLPEVPGRSVDPVLDAGLMVLGEHEQAFVANLDEQIERLRAQLEEGEAGSTRRLVAEMARADFFAQYLPTDLGGKGSGRYSTMLCRIRESLGYHSGPLDTLFGRQGVGSCAIVMMGSDEQRARFLPDLIHGRKLFAFALTEPLAGSDVLGMRTRAERVDGGHVLNGTKAFISGADEADVIIVFARTDDARRGGSISGFIVERGFAGLVTEAMPESTAPHGIATVRLTDCFVPEANLIGTEGKGLHGALGTLEVYRASIAAMVSGMAHRAFDLALDYARRREAFGAPLIELETTRIKLVSIWMEVALARILAYRAAAVRDARTPSLREAGMAKLFATEAAQRVIYDAQQIHGGRGVLQGSEIELMFRELRPATIYEGSSEVQRTIIARAELSAGVAPTGVPGPVALPDAGAVATWLGELDDSATAAAVSTALEDLRRMSVARASDAAQAAALWLGAVAAAAAGIGAEAAKLPLAPHDALEAAGTPATDPAVGAQATQGEALVIVERGDRATLARAGAAGDGSSAVPQTWELPFDTASRITALQQLVTAALQTGVQRGRYASAVDRLTDTPACPLAGRQWVQFLLADCATALDAAELTVPYAIRMLDTRHPHGVVLAATAEVAAERAREVVTRLADAVGVGSPGWHAAPSAVAATQLRAARALLGPSGANA